MKYKVFICACHTETHQFIVSYDEPGDSFNDPQVYFSIRLNSYGTFFQRLKRGIFYILKIDEAEYDSVLLDEEKTKELIKFLKQKDFSIKGP